MIDKNNVTDNTNDIDTKDNVFLKVYIFASGNKIKFLALIKIVIQFYVIYERN